MLSIEIERFGQCRHDAALAKQADNQVIILANAHRFIVANGVRLEHRMSDQRLGIAELCAFAEQEIGVNISLLTDGGRRVCERPVEHGVDAG